MGVGIRLELELEFATGKKPKRTKRKEPTRNKRNNREQHTNKHTETEDEVCITMLGRCSLACRCWLLSCVDVHSECPNSRLRVESS